MSPLLGLSGFGGGVSRFGGAFEPSDEYFNYVAMLLHGDGTNGAQNNTFLDSSSNNSTITRSGNVTQGTFNPYGDRWSNYFDGSGDYLTNSSSSFISNTVSTFTVEGWVFLNANPTLNTNDISGFVTLDGTNSSSNYMSFGPINDRTLRLRWFDGVAKSASGSTAIPLSTWTHIACVVNSNSIQFYVNGVAESMGGTTTLTNRNGVNNTSLIGANGYGAINGYISNVRVTNTAVYTSGFTPSTEPLTAISGTRVLACQSNRFKDNSTNNYTLAPTGNVSVQRFSPFAPTTAYSSTTLGGNAYFSNAGDYLTVPNSTSLNLSGGTYTIEGWINPNGDYSNYRTIIAKRILGSSTSAWEVYLRISSGVISFFNGTNYESTTTPPTNAWSYFAAVFDGTNINLYLNGTRVLQSAISNNDVTADIQIGTFSSFGEQFLGHLSDIRVTKGAALYSGTTMTVPTAPLTTTTSSGTVSLLCNFTNAAIFDNATLTNLETVGNAQVSTSVVKFGTGSMSFDGSGDYLTSYNTNLHLFGTQDFTVECWVYPNSFPSEAAIISTAHPTDYQGFTLNVGTSGNIIIALGSGGSWTVAASSGTGTLSATQWQHLALTRSGNVFRIFINGTQTWTTTNSISLTNTNNLMAIGGRTVAGGQYFNGYIDDLRITKGIARYTTTFTPPTKAFPNK